MFVRSRRRGRSISAPTSAYSTVNPMAEPAVHSPADRRRRGARSLQTLAGAAALAPVLAMFGAAIGGGSASAATAPRTAATARPATAPAARLTWHQLALINGWQSGENHYGGGNPSWAVQNGVVYLSGSIFQASGTSDQFAVLPAAARPARILYIPVYTLDGTHGFLIISPDGGIEATADTSSSAQGYTSLAAVSYPAPGLATHKLALENGWKSSNTQYGTGDPDYSVSGGMVYLSGSLHQPVGTSEIFATLPAGARPLHSMYVTVYTYSGTTGLLLVEPNGTMYAYMGGAQQYTSLAGISFPAAAVSIHKLALDNGWKSGEPAQDTGDPAYSVSGGVVHLSGSVYQPSGSNQIFAVLPKADRPAHDLYIQVMVYTPDNTADVGTVLIEPDGAMYAYSSPALDAQKYTSLAGISFPLGS
jgi:hypothetical protein